MANGALVLAMMGVRNEPVAVRRRLCSTPASVVLKNWGQGRLATFFAVPCMVLMHFTQYLMAWFFTILPDVGWG